MTMDKYEIARRDVHEPYWPLESMPAIRTARVDYDAGTHELCQKNEILPDGEVVILYKIPRVNPVAPRKYFVGMKDTDRREKKGAKLA